MLTQTNRILIPVTKKLLSMLLCASLVCSSVLPAWSGVPKGKALGRAFKSMPVSGSRLPASSFSGALSRGVLSQLIFANTALQARISAGQTEGLADFILTSPAAQRSTLLHNDFVALSLVPQAVSPAQRASALQAYQTELQSAGKTLHVSYTNLDTFLKEVEANPQAQEIIDVHNTLSGAAALALLGTRSQAPVLMQFCESAQGTIFAETATLITGRGLLQMKAYDEFNQLLAETEYKEVLAGTVAYARENNLPVNVLPESVASVTATVNETLAGFLGDSFLPNELHADASLEATRAWMGINALEFPPVVAPDPVAAVNATAPLSAEPMMLRVPSRLAKAGNSSVEEKALVSADPVQLKQDYALSKEKVNTHYADVKYADIIANAQTAAFEPALRKFVGQYGVVPSLDNPQFQALLAQNFSYELAKAAGHNKVLSKKDVQDEILKTFTRSLDPTKEVSPAVTAKDDSFLGRVKRFFKKNPDEVNAARVGLDARAAKFAGLEVSFPVDVEISKGMSIPEDFNITLKFENEDVKRAFIKRVGKLESEHFVFTRDGALLLRSTSGAERGIVGIFYEGGQAAATRLYKILVAPKFIELFNGVTNEQVARDLFVQHREALNAILSNDLKATHKEFADVLASKARELPANLQALADSGKTLAAMQAVVKELQAFKAETAGAPIELSVFMDDLGRHAQVLTAISEGMGSVGQAITAALGLLGIERGFLSQLPTSAGQVGPGTSPFIGGLQSKLGSKYTLYVGQTMSAVGNAISMTSLALGALGVLPTFPTFLGMIGGILVNGIAGNGVLKQSNVPLAKQLANDPKSASAISADLNRWASAGGMYCYLFLPVVSGLSYLLTGSAEVGLATLAAMFGVSTATPLVSAALLRGSKIKNVKEDASNKKSYWSTIKANWNFGWHSSSLKKMMGRVAAYHFAGMAFNSGPGEFFKTYFQEKFAGTTTDPSTYAMAASFASVYLTVYYGRKWGASLMKKGHITDKALIGASSALALGAGTLSVLPFWDVYTRGALWAAAGLGFANLANMEQAIELNRPANVGHSSAVSTMYVLARLSGMGTIVMGALSDGFRNFGGMEPTTATVTALTLPLAALTYATWANRDYITKDFMHEFRRWTTKTPKVLVYSALRDEVEAAMVKNTTWGTSMSGEGSDALAAQVAAGITSRYTVSLSALEQIRTGVEDKAGLDIHRLEMARKLLKRPAVEGVAGKQPLTYDAFREEVEPLYTSIVMGRATGMSAQAIEQMTNQVLDGVLAKYAVTEAEVDLIVAKLSHRTAMNRNRLQVLDKLFAIQLQHDVQAEINKQLKNATENVNRADIVKHVTEKYRGIANELGIQWPLEEGPEMAGAY